MESGGCGLPRLLYQGVRSREGMKEQAGQSREGGRSGETFLKMRAKEKAKARMRGWGGFQAPGKALPRLPGPGYEPPATLWL